VLSLSGNAHVHVISSVLKHHAYVPGFGMFAWLYKLLVARHQASFDFQFLVRLLAGRRMPR
jgi:hypothetical protein